MLRLIVAMHHCGMRNTARRPLHQRRLPLAQIVRAWGLLIFFRTAVVSSRRPFADDTADENSTRPVADAVGVSDPLVVAPSAEV